MSETLDMLAARYGILPRYRDQTGAERRTAPATARALLGAMGVAAATEAEARESLAGIRAADAARALPPWIVVEAQTAPRLAPVMGGEWRLDLEDGTVQEGRCTDAALALPALPPGLHRLSLGGGETTLIAAPPALPLPQAGWGVTLPLYGLRDAARGGLADYEDLRVALAGIGALGAGFVGINPIHAGFPTDPSAISPYSPSSRRRFNVAYIACAGEASVPGGPLVDYPPAIAARLACLREAFARLDAGERAAFAAWRAAEGAPLEAFVVHQALSDLHGAYWPDWPRAFHRPDTPETQSFAAQNPEALAFHAWLQFLAETQLGAVRAAAEAAGMAQGLYLDLAVGTHPAGAETWADPALFARGVSLGAPPDAFAPQGQSWGLAPMIPSALAARGFRPLAETLRVQLRFAGLLRIDHILGFDRTFWVPDAAGDDLAGAYVAMPKAAMLAVARIEAARAGAVIVGEDLGNIPDGLQEDLAASGLLGCRLAMFSPDSSAWPEAVLASFGTHDLPPLAAWRKGGDIGWHERLGHIDAAAAARLMAGRKEEARALARRAGGRGEDAIHRFLAGSPARLVALQIEDVLGATEQANLPGTVATHPNWRRRIGPGAVELGRSRALRRAAALMREAGR